MNDFPNLRIPLWLGLAKKDVVFVRPFIFGPWLAVALTALLTTLLGPNDSRAASWSLLCSGLGILCAYFGSVDAAALDCPWNPAGFLVGKPVSPRVVFAVKLAVLFALLVFPLTLFPAAARRENLFDAKALSIAMAVLAVVVGTSALFKSKWPAVLVHFVMAYGFGAMLPSKALLRVGAADAFELEFASVAVIVVCIAVVGVQRQWIAIVAWTLAASVTVGGFYARS